MKDYFNENSYDTKENKSINIFNWLKLKTSIYFLIKFVYYIFKYRSQASKGNFKKKGMVEASGKIFELVEECGGVFHITGIDNIRNLKKPVVFIGNHMGNIEGMTFPAIIGPFRDLVFVVKQGNMTHPFFGPIAKDANSIGVSRVKPREDFMTVINKGSEMINKGYSIIIFPQGSRKEVFNSEEFNSLGIKLAAKSKVKVIPVAVKTDFWANGKIFKDVGVLNRKNKIYMKFGEPLTITGSGKTEHKEVIDFITENLKAWGAKVK